MPKVTTQRTGIITIEEAKQTLKNAEEYPWLQCLIALAWIFGKRIHELIKVKREDIWIEEGYLFARFYVGKKRTRKSEPLPISYVKHIKLDHFGVDYILSYIKTVHASYLFPDPKNQGEDLKIHNKEFNRDYFYHVEGGHITRHKAKYYLKKANPNLWWHLFRHTLATEMSEHRKTVQQLMNWFDWDHPRTAMRYVERGGGLIEELSDRTW